jgi:single-strand DNA-binding protein
MNLFLFTGHLSAAPTLTKPNGTAVVRFRLIRNEYAGTDQESGERRDERVVAADFVCFGKRGEALAQHAQKGDAIEVQARFENNVYEKGDGEKVYSYNLVVTAWEFGAPGRQKREQLDQQAGRDR